MSKIYFKCPNCGKVREAKPDKDGVYEAYCLCGKTSVELRGFKDDLIKMFDKMNIQWGGDELLWKYKTNKGYFYANAYDGKDIVCYRYGSNYEIGLNGWGANVNLERLGDYVSTEAEAQQACDEDFKRRKAKNEKD